MTKYYELTYNEDDDPMVVERDERGEFDITRLWRGKALGEPIPETVRLYVDGEKAGRTDYVPNTLSWPICSQRFIDLLLPLAEKDFQLFKAPLFDLKTESRVPGFKIVNVTRLVNCLDPERTVAIRGSVVTPVFRTSKIPDTVHIFRAAESPWSVVFSERAVQQLMGKGLRGAAFIKRDAT